jgi:hypothetical protein
LLKGFSDSIDGEGFQEMKVLWVSIKGFSVSLIPRGRQRKGSRNDVMGSMVDPWFPWFRLREDDEVSFTTRCEKG